MKKKQTATAKRIPLTITITEMQKQHLQQLCLAHGEPGVPLASMASTAFTRGLHIIGKELQIEP